MDKTSGSRARARVRAGAATAACLLAIAPTAPAAGSRGLHGSGTTPRKPSHSPAYIGQTSQNRPISFMLSGAYVKRLRYEIADRCPGGKRLFVKAWGFPPLPIRKSHFGGRFVAKPPHSATAIVNGTFTATTISGSLRDTTQDAKTQKHCKGHATFELRRH